MARVITLKTEKIKVLNDNGEEMDGPDFRYRAILIGLIAGSEQGKPFDQMAAIIDLQDKLRAHKDGDTVIVNESEWEVLRDAVKAKRWAFASRTILDFGRHIVDAEHSTPSIAAER